MGGLKRSDGEWSESKRESEREREREVRSGSENKRN